MGRGRRGRLVPERPKRQEWRGTDPRDREVRRTGQDVSAPSPESRFPSPGSPEILRLTPEAARERRAAGHQVQYSTATFDLTAEVEWICRNVAQCVAIPLARSPLVEWVKREPDGKGGGMIEERFPALVPEVEAVSVAAHELWSEVVRLLVEDGVLTPALRTWVEAVGLEGRVRVAVDNLKSGVWVDTVLDRVRPLADLLGVVMDAHPMPVPGFASEQSNRLRRALLGLDRAADAVPQMALDVIQAQKDSRRHLREAEEAAAARDAKTLAKLGL